MRREGVSRESFVPKRQGVVLVGRIMSCSGVVLVPVGGLWRHPGAAHGHCGRALRAPGVLHAGGGGGFAPCEALRGRVVGVSQPWMAQFPPIGDGAAAVRGGMAPKPQTTSVKNAENGLLVAKWSAFWAHQCLAVVRCSHVNPLLRVSTRDTARKPAIESVSGAAQARVSGPTCAISNFARNSPVITSNIEFVPLELQRFRVVSKNDRGKLRAKFVRLGAAVVCRHRG